LGPDEIEIYQVILEQRALQGWTPLNVSARTHPLDVMSGKELTCACLDGIYLEDSLGAFSSFHELTSQILPIAKMRLVDPDKQAAVVRSNDPDVTIRKGKAVHDAARDAYATGLFSMSEIAFDREHRFALVRYDYYCGMLCGNGATLVLEKIAGRWKKIDRHCGGWIS